VLLESVLVSALLLAQLAIKFQLLQSLHLLPVRHRFRGEKIVLVAFPHSLLFLLALAMSSMFVSSFPFVFFFLLLISGSTVCFVSPILLPFSLSYIDTLSVCAFGCETYREENGKEEKEEEERQKRSFCLFLPRRLPRCATFLFVFLSRSFKEVRMKSQYNKGRKEEKLQFAKFGTRARVY